MNWWDQADCRDSDLDWFALRDQRACVEACRACPVQTDCLLAAREEEFGHPLRDVIGVRGGMTPEQRIDLYAQTPGRVIRVRKEAPHGTTAGYRQHRYRKETPCRECKAAIHEYNQRRKRAAS